MTRRRHHVVSRGYQRFFAEGERVLLIDKMAGTFTEAGTRHTFVATHFNSWKSETGWDDHLEDEWQRIENLVLPVVRELLSAPGGHAQREAAKILAAVHFARSYSLREMHELVGATVVDREGKRLAADPVFVGTYAKELGHSPVMGEIEAYVADRWDDLTKNGLFRQERMVHAYHFAKDWFEPLQVQFLYSHPRITYVTGDTPLVLADSNLLKVGIRDRLALGDAERLWMPLTTGCSMSLWGSDMAVPPDQKLAPADVQKLNWLSWRAAGRFVICHPHQDPGVALATTTLRPV
jgi:hypothetical protein